MEGFASLCSVGVDRKRFSDKDKLFLVHQINKYSRVIESKETNGPKIQEKRNIWQAIQHEFNSEPDHTEKTIQQLQKCWDNIKTSRKKKLAKERQAKMGTGGGPPTKFEDDPEIDAILQNSTVIDIPNVYDSDTSMLESTKEQEFDNVTIIEVSQNGESSAVPETSFTPPQLTMPPSSTNDQRTLTKEKDKRDGVGVCGKKRRLLGTARQAAINVELGERVKKLSKMAEHEEELHQIRLEEARTKLLIQQQMLETAKIETETAMMKKLYEEEILKRKLKCACEHWAE